ncbi:PAS sensor protein [Methanohalobium evestigatum Z-7303]|uniref:PAS sensor protein n=1 Tax=Methanohalobium evestigatum (strain ATCC BAA-1072 / DSM 3721 / NBRC 107634 / OCM 161 / Z-7303) TaxID=644295 RepID=D7EAV8_METEZ|nr:PAS domain S-box protein [Methanohalobium evestigatum]ADI74475.1 PAS sensor protein [Methanohalobium evestigatum Z-7303]
MPDEKGDQQYNDFFNLFNSINDATFVHDLKGNFLEINDTAASRLGYSKDELLSMGPQNIDSPEYAEKIADKIKKINKHKELTFESVHITKNGERIPVEINSKIIHYRNQLAILSIARQLLTAKAVSLSFHLLTNRS